MKSAIHALKFFLAVDEPDSQVTERELRCLLEYLNGAEVVVELGCYEGKTTAAFAKQTQGQVYSIDPFFKGRLPVCYGELIAKMHCRREAATNVQFLKGFSHDVAPGFNEQIDFLFIDADHRYEAIKRDWEDWAVKVKPGGFIALHDSRIAPNSPDYLGSMQFYESDVAAMKNVKEVAAVDSLAVLQVQQ